MMGLAGLFLLLELSVSGTDAAVLIACLALAAATMLFIFWVRYEAADFAPLRSRLDQLMDRRETIYDNLRDLKFEHRAGKYAEKDYEEMKAALENEAALVLTEIDQETARGLALNPGAPRRRAPAGRGGG